MADLLQGSFLTMRTENGMKVEFVIEVRDTFSNSSVPPFWHPYQKIEDPANPSNPALKIAQKFAEQRTESVIGSTCDPDDPDDFRICIKSEWQIVKRITTSEVVDMGKNETGIDADPLSQ